MKKSKFNIVFEAPIVPTKLIQSHCLQGLTIHFISPSGLKDVFLSPKTEITIPASWTSSILDTFVRRRLVRVTSNN